jgi:hypothetical protein
MQKDYLIVKILELTIQYMKNNNIEHDVEFKNFNKIFLQFRLTTLGW